jgi:alpha-galactosidase
MMTLWCIFRSPLIFGGNLPSNDAATTALISNEEVLAVNQRSRRGRQVLERGSVRAWVAEGENSGETFVAVFNLGDAAENVELPWSGLGIDAKTVELRDLWSRKSLGAVEGIDARIVPHGSVLYKTTLVSTAK